jgi:adenosylcobinamide-phosphate synthase
MVAVKSLKGESMKVYRDLVADDLGKAREAVSMIVGRDTENLSFSQVAKAAVETVAESTSDGIVAPMFYMAIGGVPLVYFYKAINTMDSMIGYKNDRYLYFGRTAAKLDDIVNYLPSRIAACCMIAAAYFLRFDAKTARKIYKRDRRNHASPNSAQTESVCAGALNVQLAGNAYYFGTLYEKPTIGDPIRPVEAEDIARTNRLMYATSLIAVLSFSVLRIGVLILIGMIA